MPTDYSGMSDPWAEMDDPFSAGRKAGAASEFSDMEDPWAEMNDPFLSKSAGDQPAATAPALDDEPPEIQRYVRHSQSNLDNDKIIKQPNGDTSTVLGTIVNFDGKETLVPTVWDGRQLEGDELIARLKKEGGTWPSADSVDEMLSTEQRIKNQYINSQKKSGPGKELSPLEVAGLVALTGKQVIKNAADGLLNTKVSVGVNGDERVGPSDYAKGAATGVGEVLSGAGWLVNRIGDTRAGQALSKLHEKAKQYHPAVKMARAVPDLLQRTVMGGQSVEEFGEDIKTYWQGKMSDVAREKQGRKVLGRDADGNLTVDIDLESIGLMTAGSLPGTAAGMGAGAGLSTALKMLPVVGKTIGAMLGFSIGEGIVAAPMAGKQAEDTIAGMTEEEMRQGVEYQSLRLVGATHEEARDTLKRAAGNDAAARAFVATVVLSAPFGRALDKVFNPGDEAGSVLGAFGRGAATEALQEAPQSAAEQLAQNFAVLQYGDPNQPLGENVAESAISGGLSGALLGGAVGASGAWDARRKQPLVTEPGFEGIPGTGGVGGQGGGPFGGGPRADAQEFTFDEVEPGVWAWTVGTPRIDSPRAQLDVLGDIAGSASRINQQATVEDAATTAMQEIEAAAAAASATTERDARIAREKAAFEARTGESSDTPATSSIPESVVSQLESVDIANLGEDTENLLVTIEQQHGSVVAGAAEDFLVDRMAGVGVPPDDRDPEQAPRAKFEVGKTDPVRVPVDQIKLSKDVPQFKEGADPETGVVEPLEGKFQHEGFNPIMVWERNNGDLEVISGRHRLDIARRSGETDILSYVVKESDGFSKQHAISLDAKLNIRDNQGEVSDYANYFKNSGSTEEQVAADGLLGRAKGRQGWTIASKGGDLLYRAHQAGELTDAQADAIASAAPGNEGLQTLGMNEVRRGASINMAVGTMQAVQAMRAMEDGSEQSDMFGGLGDAQMQSAKAIAKRVAERKRNLQEMISAAQGAAKRPDKAREMGINVKNPESIRKKITELKAQMAELDTWPTNPALRAELVGEDAFEVETVKAEPSPEISDDSLTSLDDRTQSMFGDDEEFSLTQETEEQRAERENAPQADAAPAVPDADAFTLSTGTGSAGDQLAPSTGAQSDLMGGGFKTRGEAAQSKPEAPIKQGDVSVGDTVYFTDIRDETKRLPGNFRGFSGDQVVIVPEGGGQMSLPAARVFKNDVSTLAAEIDAKANAAASSPLNDRPDPTPKQIAADNYKKGEPFTLHGQTIVIENPRDSLRGDKETGGKKWQNKMAAHYGDIKGTTAADGDNLDVFVGQNPESERIFIIDQQKKNGDQGGFDEHKVMMGFTDQAAAEKAYLDSYDKGWGIGPVTEVTPQELSDWIENGDLSLPVSAQSGTTDQGDSVEQPKAEYAPKSEIQQLNESIRALTQVMAGESGADGVGERKSAYGKGGFKNKAELAARVSSALDTIANLESLEVRADQGIYAANVTGVDTALGQLSAGPNEKAAFMEYLSERADAKEVLDRLHRLADTPWAKQVVMGALSHQAMKDLIAGKEPNYDSPLTKNPNSLSTNLRLKGEEGLWAYLQNIDIKTDKKGKITTKKANREGFIGHPEKPVNAVNGPFGACDPTWGCATYCYATKGHYNYATSVNKAEAINLAVELDPKRVGQMISAEYKTFAEYHAKKALRFFDKGDLSEAWLPVIEEVNRNGIRAQIFSKRPEVLQHVNPMNVRMLSIDEGNLDKAAAYPDLDVALVYDGSKEMTDWAIANAERLAVILPIKVGQRLLTSAEMDRLWKNPLTAVRMCPIDAGTKSLGEHDCTKCDSYGGIGCFHKSVTAKVLKAATMGIQSESEISALIEEVRREAEKLTEEDRVQVYADMAALLSKVRSGADTLTEVTDPRGFEELSGRAESGDGLAQGDGSDSSVEAPRARYNPDQSDLFAELEAIKDVDPYDTLESRPDTNEAQRDAGRDALADFFRWLTARYNRSGQPGAEGATISLLGASIYKNFKAGKPNQLVGRIARSPGDLAALAQVYRDPRFETFRIFYTNKKGKILLEKTMTTRLPSSVAFSGDFIDDIKQTKKKLKAHGYYILHNHPSGNSDPSIPDVNVTRKIALEAPGFQAHVVIDTNEYTTIDLGGSYSKTLDSSLNSVDFKSNPTKFHPALGTEINSPQEMAMVGKALANDDLAIIITTEGGRSGKVNLLASMPLGVLQNLNPFLQKQHVVALAALRRMARAGSAGGRMFIVLPKSAPLGNYDWLAPYASDVVYADGLTALPYGGVFDLDEPIGQTIGPKGNRPRRQASWVGEETGAYGNAEQIGYDASLGHYKAVFKESDDAQTHNAKVEVYEILRNGGLIDSQVLDDLKDPSDDLEYHLQRVGDKRYWSEYLNDHDGDTEKDDPIFPYDLWEIAVLAKGETENVREAGYILPDGTMLDFSGKRDGGEANDRAEDHRQLGFDMGGRSESYSEDMNRFIAAGAIRIDANSGSIHIGKLPTVAQLAGLKKVLNYNRVNELYMDLVDGSRTGSVQITEPEDIKRAVDRFYSGGKAEKSLVQQFREEPTPYGRPEFYSALTRAAQNLKEEKGPPARMLNKLRGMPGVKAEEIFWTGLEEFLRLSGPQVTKQQIVDYLAENNVRVETVVLGGDSDYAPGYYSDDERWGGESVSFDSREEATEYAMSMFGIDRDEAEYFVADAESTFTADDSTKFASYQLPGGTNYREVLLTLPVNRDSAEKKRLREILELNGRFTDAEAAAWDKAQFSESSQVFSSSHFDEPNILLHIRLNDRIDADGNKVLFVEEIQSDWAQAGRRQGFRKREPGAPELPEGYTVVQDPEQFSDYTNPNAWFVLDDKGDVVGDGATRALAIASHDQLKSALGTIPSAPFVTETNDWVRLAVKKILRLAAEGDYDKVAWTTGEQQADRYSLAKQVKSIDWERNAPEGATDFDGKPLSLRKDVTVVLIDDRVLYFLVKDDGLISTPDSQLDGKKLDEVIGKEAADKILGEDKGSLSGDGLKIGGTGMRAFYDKIVPDIIRGVTKKMGGGQIGQTLIPSAEKLGDIGKGSLAVVSASGDLIALTDYDSQAWEIARETAGATVIPASDVKRNGALVSSIDITPALRDSVMGGQGLFRVEDAPAAPEFYSALARAAEKLKQEKGTPEQMLQAMMKQPGVKKEEVEWTGLAEYMHGISAFEDRPSVTKQEIIDFLAGNGVQVKTVVLGGNDADKDALEKAFADQNFRIDMEIDYEDVSYITPDGEFVEYDELPLDLQAAVDLYSNRNPHEPKYAEYVSSGGSNYREVLLHLPRKVGDVDYVIPQLIERRDGFLRLAAKEKPGSEDAIRLAENARAVDERIEWYRTAPPYLRGQDFTDGHFEEIASNVIAHFRLDDVTGPNGEKIMRIQEAQSDWAQHGRNDGFDGGDRTALPPGTEMYEYDNTTGHYFQVVYTTGGAVGGGKTTAEEAIAAAWEQTTTVPAGPFVTNTSAWTELVAKKIFRMAAEGGYDQVVWTTGEQQAERYSLSKSVKTIAWRPIEDGKKHLYIEPMGSDDIYVVVTPEGILRDAYEGAGRALAGKSLSEVVGKDVAKKIMGDDSGELTGEGLNIGGHGMIAFYNEIFPNAMKRVSRRLGGGGIENIPTGIIENGSGFLSGTVTFKSRARLMPFIESIREKGIDGARANTDRSDNVVDFHSLTTDEYLYVMHFAKDYSGEAELSDVVISKNDLVLPGISITPAMHFAAMQGQPLFRITDQKLGSVTVADVQTIADKVGKNWNAAVTVIQSMDELPLSAQRELRRQAITGIITGYYDRRAQKVYIIADAMKNKRDAQVTLLHEAVGHLGIERVMGKDINEFLINVYESRDSDPVIAAAYEYVNRPQTYRDAPRIVQAAEMVARIAESNPKHNIVQRFIQMIRQWARKIGFDVPFSLSDIVEALRRAKRALEDGAYAGEGAGGGLFQTGYHGSPHRHSKFSTDKVGTGEGSQAFGWGIYFAQLKDVAEYYREALKRDPKNSVVKVIERIERNAKAATLDDVFFEMRRQPDLREYENDSEIKKDILIAARGRNADGTVTDEAMRAYRRLSDKMPTDNGALYTVEVPDNDELLDWDAPLSEQPQILNKLNPDAIEIVDGGNKRGPLDLKKTTGEALYNRLVQHFEANLDSRKPGLYSEERADKAASLYLKSIGIPGLRFFDHMSRNQPPPVPAFDAWASYHKGADLNTISDRDLADLRDEYNEFVNAEDRRTRNFVIFDEDRIEITDTLFRVDDQTDTPEFKAWFRDSKVVDRKGSPLLVYHGTEDEFTVFEGRVTGTAGYFTPVKGHAKLYGKLVPVYLSIQNPLDVFEFDQEGNYQEPDSPFNISLKEWREHLAGMGVTDIKFDSALDPDEGYPFWQLLDPHDANLDSNLVERIKAAGYDGTHHAEGALSPEGDSVYVPFSPTQIKSATGNNGDFDPENPNILFRVGGQPGGMPWRSGIRDRIDRIRFQIQDKLIDLKRIQEDVDPDDDANAYQKAAIWEGKAGERLNDFDEDRVQPLLEAIAATGIPWDEVGNWLVARHAAEANLYLAEINPDMDPAKRYRLSGMSNQEANVILVRHGGDQNLAAVGAMVDQINRERVDMLITDGLITPHMASLWWSRYQHYVPLKREEADNVDMLPPRGQGFSIKGKESKMRTGSADWTPGKIVANVIAQYEASVVRAEKNKVGQALLEFAIQNPDPAFWEVNPEHIRREVRNGKVISVPDNMLRPNELSVKVAGEQHIIEFKTDNPHATQLVTGLKNLQAAEMGSVMRALAAITRFMATIDTSWNPEFMAANFARDIQTAAYNLSDTDIADMRMRVLTQWPAAMRGIFSALFGDGSHPWAPKWNDFRRHGGKTGWMDIHGDIKKREADLKHAAERIAAGKPSKGWVRRFVNGVEDMNNVIENAVRLAAYKNALEVGLSKDRAAALAKDLTVNFNRKGNMGPTINAFYMFFNASMQGNVRMLQAMANSKVGRRLAYATIGFAVILDLINRALSGDDDDGENIYDAMPDYVKDHNMILMGEKEPIIKFPLPWGYNILHTIGQVIGEGVWKTMSGERVNALEMASRVALGFANAFNPMSSGTLLQMLSPTITDPLVQIAENKNFAGQPLKPEHTFDSRAPRPEYLMHWESAREASQWIAKELNDASGGNEIRPGSINLSPEWIDTILDAVTGGLGASVANTLDTTTRLVTGQEMPTENIPFLRRVTGFNSDNGLKQRYYEWSRGVAYAASERRLLKDDALIQAQSNPEHQLINVYTQTEKRLGKLRERRRQMEAQDADQALIDGVDADIRASMARFNIRYLEVMGGAE